VTRQPHTVLDHLTDTHARGGVKAGDELLMPLQPPPGSRVRINGGKYLGLEFELATDGTWLCHHLDYVFAESWPTLLASAQSGGVRVLRVGPE
jgi:hypothetical protein